MHGRLPCTNRPCITIICTVGVSEGPNSIYVEQEAVQKNFAALIQIVQKL